jgi:hypothetical protein
MNDASEVLAVIFDCLHKAFVPQSSSDGDSESSATAGSWDCQGEHPCMAHALFGLDVSEQMNCQGCGLESRHLKYTTFFHNINASALRNAKVSGYFPGYFGYCFSFLLVCCQRCCYRHCKIPFVSNL